MGKKKGTPGKRKKTDDLNVRDKKLTKAAEKEKEEKKTPEPKKKSEKKKRKKLKLNLFKGNVEILKVKLPYWKWILLLVTLGILFLGFYFLGWYFAKGKVVLAYNIDSNPELVEDNEKQGFKFGRSPTEPEGLDIYAEAVVVMDRNTGVIVAEQEKDKALPIASLTKLVTAQVALEHWDLNDELKITREVDPITISSAGLVKGEEYTVSDLVSALLISSAAEAGYTLADSYPGGAKAFVAEMNQWVKTWGFEKTEFVEPIGLNEENVSTAYEVAEITRLVLQNSTIRETVGARQAEVCSIKNECVEISNTNELLSDSEEFQGVKTGYTVAAGPCLIAWYNFDNEDLLVVLLNANDRFETAEELVRD